MLGENVYALIKVYAKTIDSIGSYSSTSSYKGIRGRFEKYKGDKLNYNGRQEIVADYVFYCDFKKDYLIDESMSAIINGREYPISFVENIGMSNATYKIYLRTK